MKTIIAIVILLIVGCAPVTSTTSTPLTPLYQVATPIGPTTHPAPLSDPVEPRSPVVMQAELNRINQRLTRLERDVLMLKERWELVFEEQRRERRRER